MDVSLKSTKSCSQRTYATCTIRRETCEGNAFNVHGSGWVDVCCPARRCCPSKRRRCQWCQRNLFIVLSSARVWLRVKIQRSPYTSRHAKILKVRELHWHFLRDHSCAHAAAAAEQTSGTHKITQLFHRKPDTRAAQLDVATTDRGQPVLSSGRVEAE